MTTLLVRRSVLLTTTIRLNLKLVALALLMVVVRMMMRNATKRLRLRHVFSTRNLRSDVATRTNRLIERQDAEKTK